ncbi:hypothetical protein [Arthrobacter sp. YN]|uniref:hypothetical protein n=1 Tax=Arthrobacter sp. YN TaxID=2020486 RepID=UPI000B5F2F6B|nr:hypothetical protein [Arthrobacter sp. YN]ASN19086.1 hypothetical protein CGK93_04830 [Arthrobacter sp. YN]
MAKNILITRDKRFRQVLVQIESRDTDLVVEKKQATGIVDERYATLEQPQELEEFLLSIRVAVVEHPDEIEFFAGAHLIHENVTFADSTAIERRLLAMDFTFEVTQGVHVSEDYLMALTVQRFRYEEVVDELVLSGLDC